jgi:hypothetical protein
MAMTPEEYRILLAEPDVLDHTTLNITLKELAFLRDIEIVNEINRVLSANRIEKPDLHSGLQNIVTDYYKVDMSSEHIERIIDLLNDLEVQNIGITGETTATASFYGSLADKWSALG